MTSTTGDVEYSTEDMFHTVQQITLFKEKIVYEITR